MNSNRYVCVKCGHRLASRGRKCPNCGRRRGRRRGRRHTVNCYVKVHVLACFIARERAEWIGPHDGPIQLHRSELN